MAEMSAQTRFACDPEVVGKVVDGEAIIINLANGMYYSANDAGGVVWTLFDNGHSIDEVAGRLVEQYEVDPPQAQADVEQLAQRLIDEGLMRAAERQAETQAVNAGGAQERRAYVAPSLEAYRDMKDLLALDPPMPALRRNPWEKS